jgi:hypothetical protein
LIILKAWFLKRGIAGADMASAEEKNAASIVGEHCEKAGTPHRRRVLCSFDEVLKPLLHKG